MERVPGIFTLGTAIALAAERHRDQTDKQGVPYVFHLIAVSSQLRGEEFKMAGYLHDIIEDTSTTFDELVRLGCPETVVDAIRLITHTNPQPSPEVYFEDIQRIADSGNQIAIDVKWADLTHNSDPNRVPNPQPSHFKKWGKYAKAKEILRPFVSNYLLEK